MRVWKVRKALVNFSRTFYLGSLYDDIYVCIHRERRNKVTRYWRMIFTKFWS